MGTERAQRREERRGWGRGAGKGWVPEPLPRLLAFFYGGAGAVFFRERKAPPYGHGRSHRHQIVI
jgi:hypothetical protein